MFFFNCNSGYFQYSAITCFKIFFSVAFVVILTACGSGSGTSSSNSSASTSSTSTSSGSSSSSSSNSSSSSSGTSCNGIQCDGTGGFRYAEALQKSIYFYEVQQAGPLPDWNRVSWRADSTPTDGVKEGVDLRGGWFDAGDHVKFGYPMAASVTMLAWGGVDYRDAYQKSGQLDELKNNLRFINDFFISAHPSANELYGQVGVGGNDHKWWGAPELVHHITDRTAFKIDMSCPGVDLAAETAAAMAASAMVFDSSDSAYSQVLIEHATELFYFAEATKGEDGKDNSYSNCITDAKAFYNATSGVYWDELAWAGVWLYRATGKQEFLDKAKTYYEQMGVENQTTIPSYRWTQGWNDKAYGVYALMALLEPSNPKYAEDTERWLNHWSEGEGKRSNAGVIIVDQWGVLRYAANTAFIAMFYSDSLAQSNPKKEAYHKFAKKQIDYALGDNPRNSSYVCGFGENPPLNPHHRGVHGSWWDSSKVPEVTRHVLYGALVGGPSNDTDYEDDRDNFVNNEVTTDYNAGFTSALAALYRTYGGEALPDSEFPPKEVAKDEWVVGVKRNNGSGTRTGIKVVVQNHTAFPARAVDNLKFRYFLDISEVVSAGLTSTDVSAEINYTQSTAAISPLIPWDEVNNIYYVEVDVTGYLLFPGGQTVHRNEVQFTLSVPDGSSVVWDNSNDPSWDDEYSITDEPWGAPVTTVPIYGGDTLLFGGTP